MNKQKIYSEDGERVGFVYYLWIVFRLKIRKLIQKFKDFQSRRPHRSFKLTRHRDAVRQLKLPGYWEFTGSVWRAIKQNGRFFLSLLAIVVFFGIIRIEMTWDRDGTSGKPVTRVYVNVSGKDVGKLNAGWAGDDWDFGRVSIIWDDPGMLARMIVNKLNDEDLLESVEEDEVKASAEKLKDLLISRKWKTLKSGQPPLKR
jgi:hypothetical protein